METTTNDICEALVIAAEQYIMPRWKTLRQDEIKAKDGNDLVTAADTEAEIFLTSFLRHAYPDALIVGEEAASVDTSLEALLLDAEHAFVIDPLDGTKSFVRGNENFAVMLAELKHGAVVRSWIYLPVQKWMYTFEAGIGVKRNGWLIREFMWPHKSWIPKGTKRGFTEFTLLTGKDRFHIVANHPCGSVGVAYAKIIGREMNYFVHPTLHPWDHLAGAAMITSLGGVVANQDAVRYEVGTTGTAIIAASDTMTWKRVSAMKGMLDD